MTDKQYINQANKLNRLPVSRLAGKFLKQNKRAPEPDSLWVLQFLVWAQESGLVNLVQPLESKLAELFSHQPNQVAGYLRLRELDLPSDQESPQDLMSDLVNELDQAMSESLRGYPPSPSLR